MTTIEMRLLAGLASSAILFGACKSAETPPPETKPVAQTQEAPKVEAKVPAGQLGAANATFARGDYKGAIAAYDQILAREPDNDVATFNRAVALQKSGDLQGAKQVYHQLLKKNEDDADSTVNLGAILKEEGKIDEAIELYKKVLKKDEYNSKVLNNLAVLYRLKKQYPKAIESLKKLLMRDQRNVEAYKNLALVSYDQKKYRLAQTILGNAQKMAEKAGKKDPDILVNLGMIHIALGDNGKAMASFKEAVAIDPNHVVANYNIGSLALQHRDYVLAERSYQVVAKAWPENYQVQTALGYALQGEQKLDEAAKQLEKARTLKEKEATAQADTGADDEQVVWQLVQIYQNANNPEQALKYADEYLRLKGKTCKETDADDVCGRYNGIKITIQMKNQPAPAEEKKKKAAGADADKIFKDAPAEGDDAAAGAAAAPAGGDNPGAEGGAKPADGQGDKAAEPKK
jgi:tetratricopeptide (TPR) repeat protein